MENYGHPSVRTRRLLMKVLAVLVTKVVLCLFSTRRSDMKGKRRIYSAGAGKVTNGTCLIFEVQNEWQKFTSLFEQTGVVLST